MRISLEWLNDYIDIQDLNPQQVSDCLTDLGLEVEEIHKIAPFDDKVVIGRVLEASQHPDADKLRVCQVDIGKGQPLNIVCGAPNARAGIHVAVAQVGAVLPGDFVIKKSKIRGVPSFGMLCSGAELKVSTDEDGILELEGLSDTQLGQPAAATLKVEDTVLELGITPNRGDCFSYIGIARDLSAKLQRPLKLPDRKDIQWNRFHEARQSHLEDVSDADRNQSFTVEQGRVDASLETEGCTRFVTHAIDNISVTDSPAWMQRRLEASGMRPINIIVDISNYVLLEWGQPNHAYDQSTLEHAKLSVRHARSEEQLKTLDGQTRALETGDLVISDGSQAVGFAGVMGGASTEVGKQTHRIVFEVAQFDPRMIRKTARKMGLHSEASHRFERGVDVEAIPRVAERLNALVQQCYAELKQTTQPEISIPVSCDQGIDVYSQPLKPARMALRISRAKTLLSMPHLTLESCKAHLTGLGFSVIDQAEDRLVVEVPSWRHDCEREVDLIEEVGRLEGYDKVIGHLPHMQLTPNPQDPFIGFAEDLRKVFAAEGFIETIQLPFVSAATVKSWGIAEQHPLWPSVKLKNPINEQEPWMSTTPLFALAQAVKSNRNRGRVGGFLFEVSKAFFTQSAQATDNDRDKAKAASGGWYDQLQRPNRALTQKASIDRKRPIECHRLAAIMDQPVQTGSWQTREQQGDVFSVKTALSTVLQQLGLPARELSWQPVDAQDFPYLHPHAAATVHSGSLCLGYVGELHPQVHQDLGLNSEEPALVLELDLETLFQAVTAERSFDNRTWRFPPVRRDVALLVETSVSASALHQVVNSFAQRKHLFEHEVFDVYQGEGVAADKKSLGLRFAFRSNDKTLTDKEVDKELQALIKALSDQLGAEQR